MIEGQRPEGVVAIRLFIEKGSTKPVTMMEIKEFWVSCTAEEKAAYVAGAQAALGF